MTDCKDKIEQKMFEKVVILNDFSFESYRDVTLRLLYLMNETNKVNNLETQFFELRLKYPEQDIVGDVRELRLKWSAC